MGKSINHPPASGAGFSVTVVSWSAAQGALLDVRRAVFVREQGVPVDLEPDAQDHHCVHFLARDDAGGPIGTARLLPDAHIGRIAVLGPWRGRGVGRALLDAALACAAERGMPQVVLHAQVQACGFYERAGFVACGGPFEEAGIAHLRMVRALDVGAARPPSG